MTTNKEKLLKEYAKLISSYFLWPLVCTGFLRVELKNGKFVKKPMSVWINVLYVAVFNMSISYLFYQLYNNWSTIVIMFAILASWHNIIYIHLFLPKRNTRIDMLNNCIDIDVLLGAGETKFMRNIATRIFIVYSFLVIFFMIIISAVNTIWLRDMFWELIVSAQICTYLYFPLFEIAVFQTVSVFPVLRVRYLNVALIKVAKLNPSYFPRYYLFSAILGRRKFDNLVKFHKRADLEQFVKAFKIIFVLVRNIEIYYKLSILASIIGSIMSTFIMVHSIIVSFLLKLDEDSTVVYISALTSVVSWLFLILCALQKEFFYEQFHQTKLICIYIQLKPSLPIEIIRLAQAVNNTVRTRNPQTSIYGMFNYDMKMLFKVVAVTLVYIITQLQMFYPAIKQKLLMSNNNGTENSL